MRGTPKNASAFFGDPGPAPTRTTSVVPLRGLGLGYGLVICDSPVFQGEVFPPAALSRPTNAIDVSFTETLNCIRMARLRNSLGCCGVGFGTKPMAVS